MTDSATLVAGLISRVVLGLAILVPAVLLVLRKRGDFQRMREARTLDALLGLAPRDRALGLFMARLTEVRDNDKQTRHQLVSAALLTHLRGAHPLLWVLAFIYAGWAVLGGIGAGGMRAGLEFMHGFSAIAGMPPDMKTEAMSATIDAMAVPLQTGMLLALVGVLFSAAVLALLEAGSARNDREAILGIIEGLDALDYPTEVRRLVVWGRGLWPAGWAGAAVLFALLGLAMPTETTLPIGDGTFYFTEHPNASSYTIQVGALHGTQLSLPESAARGEPVDALAVTIGADHILIDDVMVMQTVRLPRPEKKKPWPRRAETYPEHLVPEPIDEKLAEGRAHQERVRSFEPNLPVLTSIGLVVDATRPFREVAPMLLGCFNHGYRKVQAITRVRGGRNLAGFVPFDVLGPQELIRKRDEDTECDATAVFWVDEKATWQMVIDAASSASAAGHAVRLVPVAKGSPGTPKLAERCYTVIEIE